MSSKLVVRVKNARYELYLVEGREKNFVASYKQRGLGVIDGSVDALSADHKIEADKILAQLSQVEGSEEGQLVLDIIKRLSLLQRSMGVNGPGKGGVLFDALEEKLLTTYRKVKRMNYLIVMRENSQ